MKTINDFLQNTSLNAGQQIILAVITFFVLSLFTFFGKKIGLLIKSAYLFVYKKTLEKPLEAIKDKHNLNRRLRKGNLTFNDMEYLEDKVVKGKQLTKLEQEGYKLLLEQKKQFEEAAKNLQIPRLNLQAIDNWRPDYSEVINKIGKGL